MQRMAYDVPVQIPTSPKGDPMRKSNWSFVLLAAVIPLALALSLSAQINIGVSVRIGPPAIPVYAQPMCPGPGYLWTPGYWAWGPGGYYWVPGTWVMPPAVGVVWTPGYWGWDSMTAVFIWHAGYWGPHIGFYGGVNYGYGYPGRGYYGGYWRGGRFFYNREVNRVNINIIHNTYIRRVTYRNDSRVSYNGGRGGIRLQPTAVERRAYQQRRFAATSRQRAYWNQSAARHGQANRGGWQRFGRNAGRAQPTAQRRYEGNGHAQGYARPQGQRNYRQAQPRQQRANRNQRQNQRNQRNNSRANRNQRQRKSKPARKRNDGDHDHGHGPGRG